MTPQPGNSSPPDGTVAAVREALVDDFGFTLEDANIAASDPELRSFVEEVLEDRRAFAEAMARLSAAIQRQREALKRPV
jgi:hypothetical protein